MSRPGPAAHATVVGSVEALYLAPAAGVAMASVDVAEAVAGEGLRGDRYASGDGHWDSGCQVTLVAVETLTAITERTGLHLGAGEHRRNLVTRGVDLAALAGTPFQVGDAWLAYQKLRPGCAYLEGLTEAGMLAALAEDAGICASVVTSGRIHRGAAITVEHG